MKCDKCSQNIEDGEEREFHDQKLCDDWLHGRSFPYSNL